MQPSAGTTMRMWIDADACPGPIRDIICRAAERLAIDTTFVANHFVRVPKSPHITLRQVEHGFDIADNHIAAGVAPGDLVVTQDVPLAAEIVAAGATALNPRGTLYTANNIAAHLARRDRADELRASGIQTGGPTALDKADLQAFANALDTYLTRALKRPT